MSTLPGYKAPRNAIAQHRRGRSELPGLMHAWICAEVSLDGLAALQVVQLKRRCSRDTSL